MKRKFITNLALLLVLNLLVKPFWILGIDRSVQNTVGSEQYGMYFSLFSFSVILNIILDLGITNYNNRTIAQNPGVLTEYFSKIVPLKFGLSILYAFITIIAGLVVGYSFEQFKILFLLIINNFLLSFILYLRSNISGLQFFRTDSILSVLDRFVMIIICSILLWGEVVKSPFRIEWFVYAQTFSYLVSLFIALGIVLSKTGKIKLAFNTKYGMQILRQSYPYALLVLLMAFFNRIDSVMIERILPDGKEQAGIYAQAFRLLDAVSMFAFLFAGLLLPMFSRMLKRGENISSLLRLSFSLLIVPAFSLVMASSFYGHELMGILYNEHVSISSEVFIRLIYVFVFISTSYIFGTLLTANGSLMQLNLLASITVVLNVCLNLILIPRFKVIGAAWASIISQGFYAVSQIILARKIFSLKTHSSYSYRLVGLALCLLVTSFLLFISGIHWYISFFAICISGILFSWILRILTPGEVIKIVRSAD